MKKILLFIVAAACGYSHAAKAQTPFPTMSFVDINKIKASVLVHGDMWWNSATQTSECFFPSTTVKNIGFAAALWMSGYDASSQLHIASQMYRQNGNDYWPGPLDGTGSLSLTTSTDWDKIWKVTRTQINTFRADTVHTITNTPAPILQWPANGNTHAQGYAGAALTITTNMAPFVDLNGNGIYEPLLGEYPDVKGDQALWWIVSDNGPTHTESNGLPLGVEVRTQAYGYSRGTLIDNVIFYEYTIVNRSPNTYTNFRIGQFADMDLGSAFNDYVGFDSARRMGIVYNGVPFDSVYNYNMPIAGITMIILPGDTLTSYVPAGSFMYFNNDASVNGNPMIDTEYNNYLRSKIRDGSHITNDYTTAGIPTVGYGSGPSTNYTYTGNPADSTQWSECSSGNTPGDRRFVIASNDFTLTPGAVKKVVMALVTTNLDTTNTCGSAALSFSNIKTVADTAWHIFFNPIAPVSVSNIVSEASLKMYPNPAQDKLYVECLNNADNDGTITIYNTLGQIMNIPYSKNQGKYEMDTHNLANGMYQVLYRSKTAYKALTFIKD